MELGTDRVLVTGAAGWLGLSLVESLVRGIPDCPRLSQPQGGLKVRCLILPGQDRAPLRALSDQLEFAEGDVRRPADCQRFCEGASGAVVIHTAGIIHPRRVREFYEVNVEGTRHVLAAAQAAGLRRGVVVSSNSPCGTNPHPDHRFDEGSAYRPYMHYGRSKQQMEEFVAGLVGSGSPLQTVVIRAPWFYGPHQPPRQTLFFRMIRDGKMPIVGGGENRRSMAYVDNLAQGLILAASVPAAAGQTYWIADRQPYTMNEIVDVVERLLEVEFNQKCAHKRMKLPGIASEVAWCVDAALQSVGVYHQKFHVLSEMNKTIACSVEKAERELGYAPTVALEEGMRRSIRWCFQHGLLP